MDWSNSTRRTPRNSSSQVSKRHSARVEKPKSNQPSPIGLERRRTVSTTRPYATLDDHYRAMFGSNGEGDGPKDVQCRPVSWHPSSSHAYATSARRLPMNVQQTGSATNSRCLADSHIHPTPCEYAPISRGQTSTYYDVVRNDPIDPQWPQYVHGRVTTNGSSIYNPLAHQPTTWSTGENTSSDLQNIAQTNIPFHIVTRQEKEQNGDGKPRLTRKKSDELIGLGLYDPPDSSPPPYAEFYSTGKGLKLEETWQPLEDMEQDDDDEEESSDDEDELVQQPPQQWSQSTLPLLDMSGQSFFFEDQETVANEWWYPPSKQYAIVPQNNTVGQGWF